MLMPQTLMLLRQVVLQHLPRCSGSKLRSSLK